LLFTRHLWTDEGFEGYINCFKNLEKRPKINGKSLPGSEFVWRILSVTIFPFSKIFCCSCWRVCWRDLFSVKMKSWDSKSRWIDLAPKLELPIVASTQESTEFCSEIQIPFAWKVQLFFLKFEDLNSLNISYSPIEFLEIFCIESGNISRKSFWA